MQEYKNESLLETLTEHKKDFIKEKDPESKAAIPRQGKPLMPFPFSGVPMTPGATHRVVGYLPQVGEELTVNGLKYKVAYVNSGRGRFTAQIMKPKKGGAEDGKA